MSREETTPNQTQNENSRSPQASVEDEVEEEAGKQEQNNVPNGTHDIPHADGVEYGAGNEIRAFVRAEEDTRKEVMPTTLQIRLVLLGRAEAGKSTVISRVFDVPEKEARVNHDRAGVHDIEIGKTYPQNPGIVVHDSGGIEGGDDEAVQAITGFLQARCNAEDLKDQVHCIWYCIPLSAGRPLDKFDLRFLSNLSAFVGPVPVIVIFTKFDSLVARHRDILSRQRPRLQDVRLDETAEAKASQEFEARYLKDMQDVTKKYPKRVPYVRVGRMQGLDDGGAEHGDEKNETNAKGLINLVDEVVDERLRLIWTSVQRFNADQKIKASVQAGMRLFTTTVIANTVPFLPGKDFGVEEIVFSKIFTAIHGIWNRDDVLFFREKKTQKIFLEAIFDVGILEQVASVAFNVADIIGPFSQPRNTVKFMKVVAGLTLLHEQLFWRQKTIIAEHSQISVADGRGLQAGRGQPLSESEVKAVVNAFRRSEEGNTCRRDMCTYIDGGLSKVGVNWFKAFSSDKIEELIFESLRIARKPKAPWE